MSRLAGLQMVVVTCVLALAYGSLFVELSHADDDPQAAAQLEEKEAAEVSEQTEDTYRDVEEELREISVAVLPIGATAGVQVDPDALTDQVHMLMSTLPKVTLVDRAEIENIVEEHKMALSGMIDLAQAVQLGKMLSAQYIVVGRASMIGKNYYLVLKIINVETTKQTTIAAKGPAELDEEKDEIDFIDRGMSVVIDNIAKVLPEGVQKLQTTPLDSETLAKINELREILAPFQGMRFLIDVPESHVGNSVPDPAAQMVITHFLSRLDIEFVVLKNPPRKWKERLLQTGLYEQQKIDYLLEGEGVSEFAGRIQGLVSSRARVELRLIKLPGRNVSVIERGIGAGIDLTTSLSSKMSLEKAGAQAVEALLRRAVKKLDKPR